MPISAAGVTINVNMVAKPNPNTIDVDNDIHHCVAGAPCVISRLMKSRLMPKAIGNTPNIAVTAVNTTGRARSRHVSRIASRPRGWKGDLTRARTVFAEALKRTDIALLAYDDEAVLWGDPSPEATIERLQAFGVSEIVVKNGPNTALIAAGSAREAVPVPEVVTPVDSTAAGDSFNAGYLAARIAGAKAADAAQIAHRLAAKVLGHRGAIVPRAGAAVH